MQRLALAALALSLLTLAPTGAPTHPATLAAATAAQPVSRTFDLDFPVVARRYAERRGLEVTNAGQIDLFPLLAEYHASVDIGAFRMHVPATAFEDKGQFELFRTGCHEIAGSQLTWLEWLHQGKDKKKLSELKFEKHIKKVQKWIKGWRHTSWKNEWGAGRRDFTPTAEENAELHESASLLIDYLGRGMPLPTGRTEPQLTPIYLIPTREDFVELLCLMGWVFPHVRHEYWAEDAWSWTQFFYEDSFFFALEFAAAASASGGGEKQGYSGDYRKSIPMSHFNSEGLEQQLVQLSLRGLISNLFGDRISPSFAAGLSSVLVIDIYGEVDTRTDGDLRGKKTQERSVFVPGGNPDGGTLPPDYADGRFRSPKHGADFFIPILRKVQSDGGKEVRDKADKHRSFHILNDEETEEWLLQAPLLHFSTEKRLHAPKQEFIGDMLEFLRSYRICFMHWLRDNAKGSKTKSRPEFVRFLSALAEPEGTLERALEEVYERPLSDEGATKASLEGQFLHWLAK